jgi:hypothetical protein
VRAMISGVMSSMGLIQVTIKPVAIPISAPTVTTPAP